MTETELMSIKECIVYQFMSEIPELQIEGNEFVLEIVNRAFKKSEVINKYFSETPMDKFVKHLRKKYSK
jgi:hypothetical protein